MEPFPQSTAKNLFSLPNLFVPLMAVVKANTQWQKMNYVTHIWDKKVKRHFKCIISLKVVIFFFADFAKRWSFVEEGLQDMEKDNFFLHEQGLSQKKFSSFFK